MQFAKKKRTVSCESVKVTGSGHYYPIGTIKKIDGKGTMISIGIFCGDWRRLQKTNLRFRGRMAFLGLGLLKY